jgi:hypothetical protein
LHAPGYRSKSFTVTVRVGEVLQESGELEPDDEKR